MKTIYQLYVTFEDGSQCNLLYSSRKKAHYDAENYYPVGHFIEGLGTITNSFIDTRCLF